MNRLLLLVVVIALFPAASRADEKDDELAKKLVEAVRDNKASLWVRLEAAKTIGKLGPRASAAVPDLTSQLSRLRADELPELQETIIRSLGLIGHAARSACPTMTRVAGRNIDIDRAITQSVNQIIAASDEFDLSALIEQFRSKDESIRLRAVKALGRLGMGARAALPYLNNALADIDPDVRRAAVVAMRLILPNEKPSEAVIRVFALDLQDPDDTIRLRAAKILGRLGPAAVSAIPALEVAMNDDDRDVRKAVIDALNRISPP